MLVNLATFLQGCSEAKTKRYYTSRDTAYMHSLICESVEFRMVHATACGVTERKSRLPASCKIMVHAVAGGGPGAAG